MVMKETDLGCGWVPLYTGKPTKILENQTKSHKEGKNWGEWARTVNRPVNWRGKWMDYVITMSPYTTDAPVGRALS